MFYMNYVNRDLEFIANIDQMKQAHYVADVPSMEFSRSCIDSIVLRVGKQNCIFFF